MLLLGVKTCSFFFFCLFNKDLVTTSNRNQFCITNFLSISRMRLPIKSFLSKHRYPVTIVTENRLWKQKTTGFQQNQWTTALVAKKYGIRYIGSFSSIHSNQLQLTICEHAKGGEESDCLNHVFAVGHLSLLRQPIRNIFLLSRQQLQIFPCHSFDLF